MFRHLSLAAAFALAAATSAQAQNNKPVRSGTFYEDRASNLASNDNAVKLSFTQVPDDKFLNITRVACRVYATNAQFISFSEMYIGTAIGLSDTNRSQYLDLGQPSSIPSGNHFYHFNHAVYLKVGPGRFVGMRFIMQSTSTTGNFVSADCSYVGDLSDN